MNQHIDTAHEGKKLFKCEICEKRFTDKRGFIYHMVHVHEEEKPSDECDSTFEPEQELNNHQNSNHGNTEEIREGDS